MTGERAITLALIILGLSAFPYHDCAIAGDALTSAQHTDERAVLVAPKRGDAWTKYQAIMWQPHRAEQCAALKSVGITAGAIISDDRDNPAASATTRLAPLASCGLGFYVENIATDFYSAYHRWSPDHPVNWRFVETKKAYQANPADPSAFVRNPSLSDPLWQKKVRDRLTKTVKAYKAGAPLFYNLADEPGIAELSVFWDFDFSAPSLAAMRSWLKQQYGTLGALNRQWDSHFDAWQDVIPMTTAQAMRRSDGNFSAWADFKAFMDVAFARAIAMGTAAVHAADPHARSAIEGAQSPGWGGYDYSRFATATDVMELYDGGGNLEIARALNPKLIILTTSFNRGPREAHFIWREMLRGSSGVILWDPNSETVSADATIGPRGRDLATPLHEIEGSIGKLLRQSQRQKVPIAVLYSPASMRTQWMLDWLPKGDAWSARSADDDYEDASAVRSSMVNFLDALEHRGLEPDIVVSDFIEKGGLRRSGFRALILPRVIALSARAAAEITRFAREGGTVIADGQPGLFDEHSRLLGTPRLASLFAQAPSASSTSFAFGKGRGVYLDSGAAGPLELSQILTEAGVVPDVALGVKTGGPATDIEAYLWRNGDTTILALQRDQRDRDESGMANDGAQEIAPADGGESVVLTLPKPLYFYDVRQRRSLGLRKELDLTVDPITPTILTLARTPRAIPADALPRTQPNVKEGERIR